MYKGIYYLFKLFNDNFMQRRLAFSGSRIDQEKYNGVIDLVTNNDIHHNAYEYNILWDFHKKVDAINNSINDGIGNKKSPLSQQDEPAIRQEALQALKDLDDRYENFRSFYKKEKYISKSLRFLFMMIIPYSFFFFASYFSWNLIKLRGRFL